MNSRTEQWQALVVSYYRCFHPHVTGEEAEKLLKGSGNHGTFLCRRSEEDPNTYTLSVLYVSQYWVVYHFDCYRNFSEVMHLRMKYTSPYFSLYDTEQFYSPFDVIQHYLDGRSVLRSNNGRSVHLETPLINERTIISSRWMIYYIATIKLLLQYTDGITVAFMLMWWKCC